MAIGLPASYSATISTVGTLDDVRAAIVGVFVSMDWEYEVVDPDHYEVTFTLSPFSWGERMTVELTREGTMIVVSKCWNVFQIFDWGKNKRNVDQFTSRFSARELREALLNQNKPIYLNETGQSPVDRMISDDKLEASIQSESNKLNEKELNHLEAEFENYEKLHPCQ